jgi:hypothetical protein
MEQQGRAMAIPQETSVQAIPFRVTREAVSDAAFVVCGEM